MVICMSGALSWRVVAELLPRKHKMVEVAGQQAGSRPEGGNKRGRGLIYDLISEGITQAGETYKIHPLSLTARPCANVSVSFLSSTVITLSDITF